MSVRLTDVTSGLPIKAGHLFLILALVMAVVSALVLKNMVSSGKAGREKEAPKVVTLPVVIATRFVPAGQNLSADDLKVVPWPQEYLVRDSVFDQANDLTGRLVKSDLMPGEPVYKQKLAGENLSGTLSALVQEGYRAMTVGVSEIKGVAGFVKPGDHVDVLATFEESIGEDKDIKYTRMVLQNVVVLASAQEMVREGTSNVGLPPALSNEPAEKEDPKAKKKPKSAQELAKERKEALKIKRDNEKRAKLVSSVTLAVRPEQAEQLALAEETGTIRLALRSEADQSQVTSSGVSNQQLLGGLGGNNSTGGLQFSSASLQGSMVPKMPPAPPLPTGGKAQTPSPRPRGNAVEFIQGTEKQTVSF